MDSLETQFEELGRIEYGIYQLQLQLQELVDRRNEIYRSLDNEFNGHNMDPTGSDNKSELKTETK